MPRLPNLIEKVFVVIALFLSTTALVPLLIEDEQSSFAEDPYSPLLFMGVYAVTLLLILARRRSFLRIAQKHIWIWLVIGTAIASVLWTIAPDVTLRRSLLLLGTTLFGVYLGLRYTIREQLQLLAWMLGSVIVLSFLFAIALPNYGVMSYQESGIHAGAWRGVMTHKNILGRMMVLGTMVFLCVALTNPISNRRYQWLPWAGYILSILLIILSTSKTSLIVFLTITAIIPLYRTWRHHYTQLIPISIVVLLVLGSIAILLFDQLDFVALALGKDLTLTGRTEIWNAMLDLIWERPLFGYGYNAVWRDWNNEATAYLWRTLEWECPYGHNGFMDLWIELGLGGLLLFLTSYIITYLRGVKWLRITKTAEGLWPLMYLTFLVIYNVSESTLVATNSIFWILYVSTIFSVAVEFERAKLYRRVSPVIEEWSGIQALKVKNQESKQVRGC